MHIAYVDESGDLGQSLTYTLGCVLLDGEAWPGAFDALIGFRRWTRDRFGVLMRDEMKADFLIRNGGPFKARPLPDGMRQTIYRQALRIAAKADIRAFAVVIRKEELCEHDDQLSPRDVAWDYLLQRLRTGSERTPFGPCTVLLAHDEGETATIRKLARRARRAGTAGSRFGTGQLRVPFAKLVDDPVPKNSAHSFFIQLADLVAYAGFRRLYAPGAKVASVVPQMMWDELGDARYAEVTTSRDPLGIVHWPPATTRSASP